MDANTTQRIKDAISYEKARTEPPEGFPRLPPIPSARYIDDDFNALEKEQLWQRSWVYACHMDELPEVGSFYLWDRLGSPILIVRGKNDSVRAFYNTCRHRGGPLVKEQSGTRTLFVCGYHGWSYDHDGNLFAIRDERDFPDFDKTCLSLISVQCETFGKWIFINCDENAKPLLAFLGPVAEEMAQFQPDKLRLAHKDEWIVDCNVKVLLDAFLETYHLKSIHQHTVDVFLDYRGTAIELWANGHSRMVTPNRDTASKAAAVANMPEIETVGEIARDNNLSYNIFPNIVTPLNPIGFPFLLFWPKTNNTTVLECVWFSPDWGDGPRPDGWEQRIANFDRILEEDTQFAPHIQNSVESDGFKGIPLSYQERRIYHWHEELDRCIGENKIAEDVRVEPILSPFIVNSSKHP